MKLGGDFGPVGLIVSLFFIFLELMIWWPTVAIWSIPVWLIVFGLGAWRMSKDEEGLNRQRLSLISLSLPALVALALLLPDNGLIHVYFLLIVLFFGWFAKVGSQIQMDWWNGAVTMFLLIFNLGLILAWKAWSGTADILILGLIWVVLAILGWQAFVSVAHRRKVAVLVGLTLALVLTELGWLLFYWPLHWLAITGIVATAYYVCFHLITASWRGRMTWGVIVEYSLVSIVAVSVIIWTNQWT